MKQKQKNQPKKRYFEVKNEEYQQDMSFEETSLKWYQEKLQDDPKQFAAVKDEEMIALRDEAKKCYDAEVTNTNLKNSRKNSSFQWMKTVMAKGAIADKVAAYIVTIQDSPLCSIEQIRHLISMVKVSKKKECVYVIDNLTELFLTDLLKPNVTLKTFRERPLSLLDKFSSGNVITRKKYLCHWHFEGDLKEAYASYIQALNAVSHDTIETNKEKAVGAMYKLLCGNPEQEKNLLTYLVNKLGDPSQKVASKVIYCLTQLLFRHPNRQGVVLAEIEKLLFRQNISTKTQYYALCFLSQYYLNHDNAAIARKLIEVYFAFFKACIKKGDVNSRMMSALLMGVSRAYPYAKLEIEKISEHITTIYRVVHVANFNVALHALQLLYQVSGSSSSLNDRFYSALYKKLADSKLTTTTHSAILLNLIYKSLLRDKEPSRVKTFTKRLLQLALMAHPSFACGVLFLVSHVLHKKSDCVAFKLEKKTVFNGIDDDDDGDEKYEDVKEEETEVDLATVEAVPENNSEQVVTLNETIQDENTPEIKEDKDKQTISGWHHCKVKEVKPFKYDYNPLARNPLHAGGEFAAYIELFDLVNHFHPTVSLFASQILAGERIKYSGDPLKDFALIRFLERFVFKNPKKSDDTKTGAHPTFGQRKNYAATGVKSFSVTSSNYLDQEKNIPVDEMFLFSYLKSRRRRDQDENGDDDDIDSVCSEEFEEMLNKMGDKTLQDSDEELDYMNDIGDNLKAKKQSKSKNNDSDEEEDELSDNDEEDFGSEEDIDDENDDFKEEDIGDDFGDEMNEDDTELIGDIDDDASDIVFDDEDDEEGDNYKKNKKKKEKFGSVFASADEFASLLEDEGSSKYAPGSSNSLMNKDKADVKQLDWEEKRNRWVKGFNNVIKTGNNKFGSQKKKRKNNNENKPNRNKNKKRKMH